MIEEILNFAKLFFYLVLFVFGVGLLLGCIWAVIKRVERWINRDLYRERK